jgi:hypothetical protein
MDEAQIQICMFANVLLIVGEMCYAKATKTRKLFFETFILRSIYLTGYVDKLFMITRYCTVLSANEC